MSQALPGPGEALLDYQSDVDDTRQPFRLYVPARVRRRYPVVVCLHGFGGRMVDPPVEARRWADALGWVLLSPDGRGNQNWDGLGEEDVFAALAATARLVTLDPERTYLYGGSMGGHGGLRLALRHPHRFAAVCAVAGWLSAEQFYPRWYAAPGEWSPPAAIAPLVAAAAPTAWRDHAQFVAGRLAYGTADGVNEPEDAEWFIAWLREAGLFGRDGWACARVDRGGHGAGASWRDAFAFLRGKRRRWPTCFRSPTLRHADLGWVRADRLVDPCASVACKLAWSTGFARFDTENVAELVVTPAHGPRELGRRVRLIVNGQDAGELRRDEQAALVLSSSPAPSAKRRGVDGPIGEFFRARFQVLAPAAGPARVAAERFCADWAAWLVPAGDARLRPLPPSAARADANLMLFGDVDDNELVRRVAQWPAPLGARPVAGGIGIGEQAFAGERLGWWVLQPVPWQPARLMLLCRGYQHSNIPPDGPVGKDLEKLPWQWPDWVVWDDARECRLSVQPPLRHLPDAWVAAGSFGPDWR